MNELSLFSGAGGGLLGTKLLGFKHIGYVEYNDYCQRVIRQRIIDGILDDAPIFGDIRTFISEGYAESYQGMVDVITAGFPCQPFSVAGKQEGADDDRNMWPETITAIRIIRPRFTLLENVPGLLAHEYGRTIFRDLAESGYIPRWRILSAAEMGASHKRDRVFIVGASVIPDPKSQPSNGGNDYRKNSQHEIQKSGNSGGAADVADAKSVHVQGQPYRPRERESRGGGWWATEPGMGRVANGVAHRVDRLKALGNGQVPIVVKTAWQLLTGN